MLNAYALAYLQYMYLTARIMGLTMMKVHFPSYVLFRIKFHV